MNNKNARCSVVFRVAVVAVMACGSGAVAQDAVSGIADAPVELDIQAQPIGDALNTLAQQSGLQVVFFSEVAGDLRSREAVGEFESSEAALEYLLADTGLGYRFVNERTVAIQSPSAAVADDERGNSDSKNLTRSGALMLRTATPTSGNDSAAATAGRAARSDEAGRQAEDDDDREEIIVTGSQLITDPGKMTRQITVFNRAEIERSGVTRLDEFLRRLPQNLNAPGNVGSGIAGVNQQFGLGANVFAGSTINLRGLGAQYTLILINGRRPARSGQFGDVTDISNIPIDRVERIEVLFDGAAAIYGADAVGGVVNIITRQDYGGTNLSLTYSDTEDGGGARYNLQLGHTFNWGSGSLTASAGYQTQEQIAGGQRLGSQMTQTAADALGDAFLPPSANGSIRGPISNFELFSLGLAAPEYDALFWVNGDQRLSGSVEVPALRFAVGGLVETTALVNRRTGLLPLGYFWIDEENDRPQNPETLGFTPVFQASLPEYSGQPLGLGEVGTSNELVDNYVPFYGQALSPEDDTYSLGLSLNQEVSARLRLALNLDYSTTGKFNPNAEPYAVAEIPADSPSNPFGQRIFYGIQGQFQFPPQYQDIKTTHSNVSGGIDWDFAEDWSLNLGFGYSEQESDAETFNSLRPLGPDSLDSRLNGYYNKRFLPDGVTLVRELTGSNFNDPLLGYDSFDEMIAAMVIPLQRTLTHSTQYEADLRLRGKLFTLPAGDVRSGVSLRYREDENETLTSDRAFFDTGVVFLDKRPGTPVDERYNERFGENVKTLAAEVSVPVFGSDVRLPLVDSFLLSFAGSAEEYSNTVENGVNWAVGFNWGVNEQFVVRFNRTYNLRVPASVRTAQGARWSFGPHYNVYLDPEDPGSSIRINERRWNIWGGANHLRPERNYGTALSFIYRPSFAEGLDIQVNLTQSDTVDQIGNPFAGRLTFDALLPENVSANPVLDFGDPANNPFHASAADVFRGVRYEMAPGDLITDSRDYNIGDTFNRGADFQISYNLATRFGDWLLTWRHQYLDTNEVTRSNLCDQVEQGCTVGSTLVTGIDEPIDTVGSVSRDNFFSSIFALPRNQGSIDLFWDYRGLGVNLSTQYTSTTSVFRTKDLFENVVTGYVEFFGRRFPITERQFLGTNVYREDSRPEQTVHLSLSYDFARGSLFEAPGWLGDARISLTVDNLYQISERKQSTTIVQNEADSFDRSFEEVNRFTIFPRGRSYALRFSTTF